MLYSCDLFEVVGEAEEENFSLLLEEDGTSSEEDISLNLGPFFDELLGVLKFESVVVIVGLWTETDFLDDSLDLLCLDFLLFLLLLVKELLVIEDAAYWRVGRWGDFDEVELKLVGQLHGVLDGVDARILYIVADQTHLRDTDFVVNPVFGFWLLRTFSALIVSAISAVTGRTPIVIGGGIHYALRLLFIVMKFRHKDTHRFDFPMHILARNRR